jgi:hypothetical protein
MPIQRIPRYVLLLRELIKSTNQQHPDYENLNNALAQIKELADYINTRKRDTDEANKILAIQKRIIGWPAVPKIPLNYLTFYRTKLLPKNIADCSEKAFFVSETMIVLEILIVTFYWDSLVSKWRLRKAYSEDMNKDKLKVFLFNDALLYCKPKGKDQLKYKGLIPLQTATLSFSKLFFLHSLTS